MNCTFRERRRSLFALSIVLLIGVNTSAQEPPQNSRRRSPEDVGKLFEGAWILQEKTAPVAVPEPTEKAIHYYQSGNALWLIGKVWSILIPCLFLFTGLSARLQTWAQRLGRRWFFVIAI